MMEKQFNKLWSQLGISGGPAAEFQLLYNAYTQPDRFYHNLNHIEACLNDFQEVSSLTNTPNLVKLAVWYHDVIYDVHRSDNEQKSADLASDVCSMAGLSNEIIQEVCNLILATKHHQPSDSINQMIVIDVDLAILGKPPLEYDIYEKAIRKEYSHISDSDFQKGRIDILQSFLEKPSIYSLDFFKNKYQQQAIQNIKKAMSDLS